MKNKIIALSAPVLMILLGVIKGLGGYRLISGRVEDALIVARKIDIFTVGMNTLISCLLLVLSAVILMARRSDKSYVFCYLALGIFVFMSLGNSQLLYGSLRLWGQLVNIGSAVVLAAMLFWAQNLESEEE